MCRRNNGSIGKRINGSVCCGTMDRWTGKSVALLVKVLMDQWVDESMDQLVGKSMHDG